VSTPKLHFPDDLRSDEELGCIAGNESTSFRVFAPRAASVTLVLFETPDAATGRETPMERERGGTWKVTLPVHLVGKWYGYRVDGPRDPGEMFDPAIIIADPYSRAVSTKNTWRMEARTLIAETSFDWGDDRCPLPDDRAGLIIYECHVRDLTAHPGPGPVGAYNSLAHPGNKALSHIMSLGVNTVEFLPLMKFGTMEIPYRDDSIRTHDGMVNTWNPYPRNHWGYMTSFFFAPETYYASDGTGEPGAWNGTDARAITELKGLIRTLHSEGISVIMDVVYNHTSQYDLNPLKYLDKFYYYHCDPGGTFLGESGCGNDFHTGRPMGARLILDSLGYWMREYHVDGFRFDLAAMIDEDTCRRITAEVRTINPKAVLIAEPWGGGRHHPPWFDELGWSSWNDRYRDALKGRDPVNGRGAIFGPPDGDTTLLSDVLSGSPRDAGGLFSDIRHGVSYLESHDGYTLGDFIRIASGEYPAGHRFGDGMRPGAPEGIRLGLNRLSALVLLTSPGPVMLHEGQEFARSKVIARTDADDPDIGMFDHNSYNKDNDTNHIDYRLTISDRSLSKYYSDLVALRRRHPALAGIRGSRSVIFPRGDATVVAVTITDEGNPATGRFDRYIVLINFHTTDQVVYDFPEGSWCSLAGPAGVEAAGSEPITGKSVSVPASAGAVFGRVFKKW